MNKFIEQFRPTYIAANVDALTPDLFVSSGILEDIDGVAFDVDGTLVNHHDTEVSDTTVRMIHNLAEIGLALFVISNAYGERVDELEDMFGKDTMGMRILTPIDVAGGDNPKHHRKPSPEMLRLAMSYVEGPVLMAGDQMAKDTWSANRAGAPSLLVPRRGAGDDWKVRTMQRPLETTLRMGLQLPHSAGAYPADIQAVAPAK